MGKTITSALAFKIIEFTKNKGLIYNQDNFNLYVENKKLENNEEYKLPFVIEKLYKTDFLDGMKYYIINPKKNSKKKKLIFYLHGGSYIDNPTVFHWTFLNKLARKTRATIIVPIYPKVPISNYKESQDKILKLYKKIIAIYDTTNFTLMGDSAGGGLALALAEILKDRKILMPSNLILISPWLDIRLNNENIKDYEKFDPSLDKELLKQLGVLWSNNDDNYLVNPIDGNIANLPQITLFTSLNEILYPDSDLFYQKCKQNNIPLKYIVNKNMYHCYPLFPVPDGRKATRQIIRIINKESLPIWVKKLFKN